MPKRDATRSEKSAGKLTIGAKISMLVLAAITLSIAMVEGFAYFRHQAHALDAKALESRVITELTAGSSGGALKFKKAANLEDLFASVAASLPGSAARIAAFDSKGELVAIFPPDATQSAEMQAAVEASVGSAEYAGSAEGFATAAPVLFGPKKAFVGVVAFDWDHSAMIRDLQKTGLVAASGGVVVAVIMSILLALALGKMIAAPLKVLSKRIEWLAAGQRVKIPYLERGDEIGMLAQSMRSLHDQSLYGQRLRLALESASSAISITNGDGEIIYANRAFNTTSQRSGGPGAVEGSLLANLDPAPSERAGKLSGLLASYSDQVDMGGRVIDRKTGPIFNAEGQSIGIVSEWWDRTDQARMEHQINQVVEAAANGDFSQRIAGGAADNSSSALTDGLNRICSSSESFLSDLEAALNRIANGDLTRGIEASYQGRYDVLSQDLSATMSMLAKLIHQVTEASVEIDEKIGNVRTGASEMATRSESQAAALEQTSTTMDQMLEVVSKNTDMARAARDVANDASTRAESGGETVNRAVEAMREIEEKSQRITEVTAMIENIAFQTNLLALNASVEAARAGAAGKGFAVVASEVRNLAHRASSAASDIHSLVEQTHGAVIEGGKLVDSTGEIFGEIVDGVKRVSESVVSIADASDHQNTAVREVSKVVGTLDEATLRSSQLADSSEANAVSLSEVSERLNSAVSQFSTERRPVPEKSAA